MKQLSALLNLPFVGNLQTVPAEVTDFAPSDFAATIDISVGRDEGVQLNMPVVGAGRPGRAGGPGQPQHGHGAPDHRRPVVGRRPLRPGGGPSLAVLNGQGSGKPLTADLVPDQHAPHRRRGLHHQRAARAPTSPAGIPVATVVAAENGATAVAGVGDPRSRWPTWPTSATCRCCGPSS